MVAEGGIINGQDAVKCSSGWAPVPTASLGTKKWTTSRRDSWHTMKTHWCCLLYRTSQHEWQPMPFINFTSNDSNSNLSDHYEFWVRSVVLEVAWIPRASTILQYASVDRAKDWTLRACWRWFLRLDYLQRRVFGHGAVAPNGELHILGVSILLWASQKSWDTPKVIQSARVPDFSFASHCFFRQ